MDAYVLPDLPYDYAALEPHISAQIMELHHGKHHATYVAGANAALDGLEKARAIGDTTKVGQLTRDLAFNLAGHMNHSIFWKNLSPDGGGEPAGELADAIANDFGSFDAFKKQFTALATSMQGSGWVALAYEPLAQRLVTFRIHDHQNGVAACSVPLLLLDVWEHAFYLDYKNSKPDFVKAFWNVVNWDDVAARYEKVAA